MEPHATPSDPPRPGRLAHIADRYARAPRALRGTIAVVAVVLGGILVLRPTMTLGLGAALIGVAALVTAVITLVEDPQQSRVRRVGVAAVWLVAGLFVLTWPGLTVRLLALAIGAALVVNGVVSAVSAIRRGESPDQRIAGVLLGVAGVVFGLLALLWPDITLIIAAVIIGARILLAGVVELWRVVRNQGPDETSSEADTAGAPTTARRWRRVIGSVAAIALAVGAVAVSSTLRAGSTVTDPFYVPPRSVPDEPGRLIRSEPFTRAVPAGAQAWRILYTTSNADGSPGVASGIVVAPADGDGPWPVIEWSHGTTGFAEHCAPSLLAQPFESGALFLLPDILENGWALVATDYIGLGTTGPHPYLIGRPSAHAALDSVRAARELSEAHLDDRTVAWGHSQGGGAALWTGAVADDYAPDVSLAGVAALAPAANLPAMTDNLSEITGGSVFASFVVAAYTSQYADVTHRDYLRPGAEVTVRRMAERCLSGSGIFASVLVALSLTGDPDILSRSPTEGALGVRLVENIPPATISAPLFLGQGSVDSIVERGAQDDLVDGLCAGGAAVDYRVYDGLDHLALVAADSPLVPELVEWTRDRFDGVPAEPGCPDR